MVRLPILIALLFCTLSSFAQTPVGDPIRFVRTQDKIALLSFDDGPSVPYTEQILDILDKHKVKATFFVVGINVKSHPELIKDIIKRGHSIGNHSMSHAKLKNKSKQSIKQDIDNTDKLIKKLGYDSVIPFRAPFGQLSNNLKVALRELNKPHVLFNFLPKDWENPPPEVITKRVLERAKPGFIITLHDGWKKRRNTVLATEMIIVALKNQGYRFVTADEFLEYDKRSR